MDPPRAKRQKVTIACDACRSRKAKCDGSEPVCGPCRKRSGPSATECTWSASSRLHTSNSHIRQLQDRIAELESDRHGLDDPRNTAKPSSSTTSAPAHSTARHIDSNDAHSTQPIDDAVDDAHVEESSPVYTVIGPTVTKENREGFFGGSSAGTFMQNVSMMVEQRLDGSTSTHTAFLSPPGQPSGGGYRSPNPRRGQSAVYDQEQISLPLRKVADELMQVYWRYFHPIFPILDHGETQEVYESLWTGRDNDVDQRSFLCLLNAMFALASQLNPRTRPQDRARMADNYFRRCQNLLDIFERGSLRTAQSLLLLSMYCQSSSNAHQCWIFMGLAIRVVQGLGLHSPHTSKKAPDAETGEIYRRVWHGCVLLDQIIGSTYGRPCGIGPRNTFVVPLPSAGRGSNESIVIDHFNHAVKLCRILHETIYSICSPLVSQVQSLDELYDHYFGHNPQDPGKPSVFDVEKDLKQWRQNTPDHLKLESSGRPLQGDGMQDELAIQHRFAVMLQQNYHHVCMLLLRPFLSAVVTFEPSVGSPGPSTTTNSLSWNISLQCAVACVREAQNLVSLLHTERASHIQDVGSASAWWFNVLHIYTAATILIASLLSPAIHKDISQTSILASWQLALKLLDGYTVFGSHITRLVTTLRILHDTVPTQHSYRKRQQDRQRTEYQQSVQSTSTTKNAFIDVPDGERAVRWRISSPPTPSAGQVGAGDGWNVPDTGQYLSFSPLPNGYFNPADDPFDFAWLTDLPPDMSF